MFVEALNDRTVVDLGCGNGYLLRKLRAQGHPRLLLGVDMSYSSLLRCKSKEECYPTGEVGEISYIQADGNELPLKDASVDHVVASVVLYLLDQGKVLGEVERVLLPGGRFTFTDARAWYYVRRILNSEDQPSTSSRLRSIVGLLYILLNGAVYNYLGIRPLLKSLTCGMWYIFLSKRRLNIDAAKAGLVVVDEEVLTHWRGLPVLVRMTLQKAEEELD